MHSKERSIRRDAGRPGRKVTDYKVLATQGKNPVGAVGVSTELVTRADEPSPDLISASPAGDRGGLRRLAVAGCDPRGHGGAGELTREKRRAE